MAVTLFTQMVKTQESICSEHVIQLTLFVLYAHILHSHDH